MTKRETLEKKRIHLLELRKNLRSTHFRDLQWYPTESICIPLANLTEDLAERIALGIINKIEHEILETEFLLDFYLHGKEGGIE